MSVKGFEIKFKIKLNWFEQSVELLTTPNISQTILAARFRKLDQHYNEFSEAYERILNLKSENSDDIAEYDKKFKIGTMHFNTLEAAALGFSNVSEGTQNIVSDKTTTRLPSINLPIYDGDIFCWSSFISLFTSLVLNRNDISKTEKFHYLYSHVIKEARLLIKHLPMTDESLDCGLEILRSRYENIRLLADSHISRILHLPVLKQAYGLRNKILNPLLESSRALKNLGFNIDEWSYMLLHIALTKLPSDIKSRFEQKHGGNNNKLPTFAELMDFLQIECRLLDTSANSDFGNLAQSDRTRRTRDVHTVTSGREGNKGNISSIVNKADINKNTDINTCKFCSRVGHVLSRCYKFKELSLNDRKSWVRNKDLCFRCLGDHHANMCEKKGSCGRCGHSGHHILICFKNKSYNQYPHSVSGNNKSFNNNKRFSNNNKQRRTNTVYDRRNRVPLKSGMQKNAGRRSVHTTPPGDKRSGSVTSSQQGARARNNK